MLKANEYIFNELFGIDSYTFSQFHKASERGMTPIRRSLKRVIKSAQKQLKTKIGDFSYIRQFDAVSHSAKVLDKKYLDRKYYICLMMGEDLYLEEFSPFEPTPGIGYAIDGLYSEPIVIPVSAMKRIFDCIPESAYDLQDNFCRVNKDDFKEGVRSFLSQQEKKPL